MKAIGIDIGTTSVCGVVIDSESGAVVKSRTENSNAFITGCADREKIQDVDRIMTVAMGILNKLISEDVCVIGVTGQMHGIVYTDKDGNVVSPLYTWQDGRGNLAFRDTTYAKYLGSFSGYGNVTDFYNRTNGIRPDNAVSYCTIHDYFVMKLCGLKTPVIHTSDAASFGCFDLHTRTFDYDFSPEITGEYLIAGRYKGIPVGVAIGDNQASVFSSAMADDILINVGTGSQVSVISEEIVIGENIETRPYFENKYLVVGSALCGGRAYSLLKDFFAGAISAFAEVEDDAIYGMMADMLNNEKNRTLKADTRFDGTRADSSIRGSLTGISCDNFTPGNMVYAFLNGMVDELSGMYEKMGMKRYSVAASGNGIRKNPALVKIVENKFSSSVKIPAHMEEAAVGAAMFGLVCAGVYKNAAEAQRLIKYIRE